MSVTRTQSGAALLVAMIMIFMLSVLGISAMRGANLERRMTENAIQSATSFQLAESAGELLLNDRVNLGLAFAMNGDALAIDTGFEPGEGVEASSTIRYVGDGAALGFSLGQGSNNFMALRYDVDSDAAIPAVRSYSSVTQGAQRIVPAP